MLDSIFQSVLDSSTTLSTISLSTFLLCLAVSFFIGLFLAFVYKSISKSSQSFLITLAILPAVVSVVIMMVNGSVGAGVAVTGAFSLARFRSAPGSAKEICAIFIAMAAGLAAGMGYIAFAALFAFLLCMALFFYHSAPMRRLYQTETEKVLKITIPEDLDYTGVFDDLFQKYLTGCELMEVKTTNMGSLFRLTYHVSLKNEIGEKKMLDAIRCRNGNLEVSLSRGLSGQYEL